jgi:hypothetical protein
MTTSPRLEFTYLEEGETVPETSVNHALRRIEPASGHWHIEDRDLSAPDGSEFDGAAYIISGTASGAWTGNTGKIAYYMGTGGWEYFTIWEGFTFWIKDENKFLVADSLSTFEEVSLGGTASTTWSLAGSWTYSVNVANVDITGLAGARDILIIGRGIVLAVSGTPIIRVSTNNGSTFFSTSGNYVAVSSVGVESNSAGIALNDSNGTTASSGAVLIQAANVLGAPRPLTNLGSPTASSAILRLFVGDTANDIDAIRLIPGSGGNITAGSLYVFKR